MNTLSNAIAVVERWISTRITDVRFDEHGVAAIMRDDETLVVIEVAADGIICHLYAPVCRPPDEMPEIALITALELNRFGRPLGGCWLAWDADVSMFALCHNLRIPDNDEQTFNNTLDHFLMSIDLAREQLSTRSQSDNTTRSIAQLA
ncbi:MAG: type III secretion system chaperone [Oxalobacteraceae bacterium]|jgi:hypothetical protein|nr:type III secretion system chaperone [Oxalobacteraceae bacterium]